MPVTYEQHLNMEGPGGGHWAYHRPFFGAVDYLCLHFPNIPRSQVIHDLAVGLRMFWVDTLGGEKDWQEAISWNPEFQLIEKWSKKEA